MSCPGSPGILEPHAHPAEDSALPQRHSADYALQPVRVHPSATRMCVAVYLKRGVAEPALASAWMYSAASVLRSLK
jgi:hypothetical protein